MKVNVVNLETGQTVGDIELNEALFGLPKRKDLLHRAVRYQLAKRQSGNHKTKGISEVQGTTKKPYRQKGTGHARQGSLRSPQYRGGGIIFGPVVRSHAFDLPKKVRKLALKTALSAKAADLKISVVDNHNITSHKTKDFKSTLAKLGLKSALIVTGEQTPDNLKRAVANIPFIDVLSQQGLNVYDILRHENVLLTKDAIRYLEENFA